MLVVALVVGFLLPNNISFLGSLILLVVFYVVYFVFIKPVIKMIDKELHSFERISKKIIAKYGTPDERGISIFPEEKMRDVGVLEEITWTWHKKEGDWKVVFYRDKDGWADYDDAAES